MRDWLSRKAWNAEKKFFRDQEATNRTKSSCSLITEEERITLTPQELRETAWRRWMELKHTGRCHELKINEVNAR